MRLSADEYEDLMRRRAGGRPAPEPVKEPGTAAKPRKKPDDEEHRQQAALFEWASLMVPKWPVLELMYAIPNGGHRVPAVAAQLKAEGVKDGVPDVCLPVARQGYHGLYIEMKSSTGRLTRRQPWWRDQLREQGYRHDVCYNWEQAQLVLVDYLTNERQED